MDAKTTERLTRESQEVSSLEFRSMRKLIVLLMCLALPMQVWAGMFSLPDPCPMQDIAMTVPSGDAEAVDAGSIEPMADCCNDVATFLETGQPCKSGVKCGTSSVTLMPMDLGVAPPARHAEHPPRAGMLMVSVNRFAIWRPPTPR